MGGKCTGYWLLPTGYCNMVSVRVPATIANWGPAFDALGVAVTVYNTVQAQASPSPSVYVGGYGVETLPADSTNLVYRAAAAGAQRTGHAAHFSGRNPGGPPLGDRENTSLDSRHGRNPH